MADLLETAKKWFRESQPSRTQWARQAEEAYNFVSGDQWSQEDLDKLSDEERPAITYNRIGPLVEFIAGSEVSNRQEVRYIPVEMGDQGVSEVLTNAAEVIREGCDAADEESDAFKDTIICGLGWTVTRPCYDENPDGDIVIERVDPFEMWWDHRAKKRNLADARFVGRIKDIDYDVAQDTWPGFDKDELHAGWADEYSDDRPFEPHNATLAPFYKGDNPTGRDPEKKKCRVVEVQWWELGEPFYRAIDVDGVEKSFSEEEWDRIKKALGKSAPKAVKQRTRVYKRAFLGSVVLEEGDAPCKHGFTFKAITGYRHRNKNIWYGIVKAAVDPQKWANKFHSQILHILNSAAKGGVMYEQGAIQDIRKFEQNYAKPGAALEFKQGAISGGRVTERKQSQMPTGFEKAMEWAVVAIRDSTGVSVEAQGLTDRQQAGVLEYQRKQATLTVLATLFDGLRRYRKEQGRLLLYMIQEYISDGRLIRMIGDNGQIRYVPLAKNPDVVKYDVIVDDAPDAPNMKERVWAVLQSMAPVLQNAPPQIWAELVAYAPLPETLSMKIRNILSGLGQQIPPEIQKTIDDMQKTIEQLKQENVTLKDKKVETQQQIQMKAAETQANLQMKETELQADIAMKQAELNAKLEMQRAELIAKLELQARELEAQVTALQAKSEAETQKVAQSAPSRKTKKRIKLTRDPETGKTVGAEVEESDETPPPPPPRKRKFSVNRENGALIITE
jgi:hypothetical protein